MSEWVGYYEQATRSEMRFSIFDLDSTQNIIRATGIDICGTFAMTGLINQGMVYIEKRYPTHMIYYRGIYNESRSEIHGFWGFNHFKNQAPFWIGRLSDFDARRFRENLRRPDEWS